MAQDKSFGNTLYFSQFGGERPIPDVFVAAMERAEERTAGFVPDAEIPQEVLNDPNVVEVFFDTRERRTNEKVLVVIRKKEGNIVLRDFRTTDQGFTLQVDSTLFYTTDSTFSHSYPSATQDVAIRDLGNRWSIQEVAVMGTFDDDGVFVAGIYQGIELSKRREDPVPERFRTGLPLTETQSIEEGTVAAPTLGTNDLNASERQIAQHRKLLSRLTREGVTLPFSLVSKRTNEKKQVVVVTDTYRVATTAPSVSATQDVQVLDLGEGHEVATTEVISEVFGGESYTKQIEDLLPSRFRGALPTTLFRQVLEGTVAEPTLGTGELRRTEEQITVLTMLVEVLSRTGVSFPITIVDNATITEYGGGEVTITSSINVNGTYSVQTGEGVVSSKITKLGEGHELRETVARVAGSWPALPFASLDETNRTIIAGTKQVVAKGSTSAGVSGDNVTEIKEIDNWREERIIRNFPTSTLDSYSRVLHTNTNIELPASLQSVTSYMQIHGGNGSYSEGGSYNIGGNGSGGVDLSGNAQASAAIIPEIGYVIRTYNGNNVPCRHILFLAAFGSTRSQILSLATTKLGLTVNDWPKFSAQPVTVLCVGQTSSIRVNATQRVHSSTKVDYLGAVKSTGESRSAGTGAQSEVGVDIKVVRISPCIHPILAIGGDTSHDLPTGYLAQAQISSGAAGSPAVTSLIGYAAVAGAVSFIQGNEATPGISAVPSSGVYAHRIVTEADEVRNRIRVMVEVIDFADIV